MAILVVQILTTKTKDVSGWRTCLYATIKQWNDRQYIPPRVRRKLQCYFAEDNQYVSGHDCTSRQLLLLNMHPDVHDIGHLEH